MKRLLAILLAAIYITTTSGIVISTHYCMGEISAVALGQQDNNTCGTCGMENEGCCHDDLSVLKLTDNHQFSVLSVDVPSFEAPVLHHMAPELDPWLSGSKPAQVSNNSPPLAFSRNTLYCVFRI